MTVRSQANDEASFSGFHVASVLDQMPVGVGLYDNAGQLVHANRHFENVAGGPIPSIHVMTRALWHVISDSEDVCGDEQTWPLHRALNGRLGTPMVDFLRKFECGMERLVGISAVPLIGDEGSVTGAIVIVKDISARRQDIVDAKIDFTNFRRFADYSANALLISNIETGDIEYMSPSALRLWSACRRISTIDEWVSSIHGDDRAQAVNHRRAAANGEYQRFHYRIVDDSGAVTRHLRETCFSIPGETGAVGAMGAIVEDISPELQVYLVKSGGNSISDLAQELEASGNRVKTFASHEDLASVADVLHPGCIVVDLRGSDADSGGIAGILKGRPMDLQVILVGPADTPARHVVTAMRAGARDFLLEPLTPGALTLAVETAAAVLPGRNEVPDLKRLELAQRLTSLPQREREVLLGLVASGTNKSIGRRLGISPRTVEVHRAHLMERMNVRSLAELLSLAHEAGLRAS